MKKILSAFVAMCLFLSATFAQETHLSPKAVGVSFFLNDFLSAQRIRTGSLTQVISDKKFAKLNEMNAGMAVNYYKGLSKYVDMATTLGGSFLRYPMPGRTSFGSKFLLEANAAVKLNLVTDDYIVQPYVTAGVGAHKYGPTFGAFMPLGIGLKVNIMREASIIINSTYRTPITTETANYHFQHSIGVAAPIFKKKAAVVPPPPPPPPPPADTDGDGVIDTQDKCPTVKGLAKYQGCPVPDTDKDGVNDEQDKCPTVAGLARYQGCPIPDTDKDGINDEEDKCPTVPGVARYQGCPIPDTDADGVNDEADRCPTEKGSAANNGCPTLAEFKFDAGKVQFQTGSALLTKAALAELNKGAKILGEHPSLKISIEGHTDNTGKPAKNLVLSEKRAAAVKKYLVSKGVSADRLSSKGFGQTVPVADNKKAAGRAANRRVEFKTAN